MWLIERIPDEDRLFYRIHKSYIVEGEVVPGAFQERGEDDTRGMSTDWEKYSTAESAWLRSKIPTDNGIVEFIVGEIRAIRLPMSLCRAANFIWGAKLHRMRCRTTWWTLLASG